MQKIVMDAGHGYLTAGKRTPDGTLREYQFNSAVAKYVREKLLHYEKVEVLFTHSDERDVPLIERSNTANEWHADVFISIHANAFGKGDWNNVSGIETFVHISKPSEALQLARCVQQQFIQQTKRKDRGVKLADFHVLRETHMTAILVECEFMTNREAASLLKSERYQQTCANSIVQALVEMYRLIPKKQPEHEDPLQDEHQEEEGHDVDTWYRVQVGAFRSKQKAMELQARLKKEGYAAFVR
ncbi:N-acetylmuramoyl-L-alanine amidase [Longirhabdus pacifica]|uniref:N-acetylmuramoyl-L-alanine amidase n=1 Tax=Longirhabdus pacifica TaxID=2305227 RepID=UPI001F0BCB9C|nr:N-acetylmuramoyl-L-alanine amidase [Longirhabdus pacifica]